MTLTDLLGDPHLADLGLQTHYAVLHQLGEAGEDVLRILSNFWMSKFGDWDHVVGISYA